MCRLLGWKVISHTRLWSWLDAAVVANKSDETTITLSLFMSIVVGVVGVSKDDNFTSNSTSWVRLMPESWNPTLRLITSEEKVSSVPDCSTSTVKLKSLKLSNYSGKVRNSHYPSLMSMLHTIASWRKVVCLTSMFDEVTLVRVTTPYPTWFYGFMMVSVMNSSLYYT